MMDEKVLEALEPHPNLETLEIHGLKGSYFPLWMTKMENATKIIIRNCANCSRIPLGDLRRLRFIHLENLADLEYILEDEIRGHNSPRPKFPSMEHLQLYSLPNLKGLLKEEVGEMFPNIRNLYIYDGQLFILPPLSTLEKLEARSCSLLTFSSFSKLENLTSLVLEFDKNTTICIPEDTSEGLCNIMELRVSNAREHFLPEKWFRDLKSLTKLVLEIDSSNIASFPEGWLLHLNALEELRIYNCSELGQLPKEIKYLHILKRLKLYDLENIVFLPQVLQDVTSLQSLELISLPQQTALPDWLGDLTSLTRLEIIGCLWVSSLPSCIQGMTTLRFLRISGCAQLARRCEKEQGEDWHKIAHIPQVDIKFHRNVL